MDNFRILQKFLVLNHKRRFMDNSPVTLHIIKTYHICDKGLVVMPKYIIVDSFVRMEAITCQSKKLSTGKRTETTFQNKKGCVKTQYGVSIKRSVKLRDGPLSNILLGAIISSHELICKCQAQGVILITRLIVLRNKNSMCI